MIDADSQPMVAIFSDGTGFYLLIRHLQKESKLYSSRFMVSLPILMFLKQVCLHLALELENVCASFILYGLNWPCCLLWLMLLTACSAIIVLFSSRGWNWTMQKSGLDINEFFLWGNVLKQDQKIKYTIYRTTEKSFIYLSDKTDNTS